jgi:hypothetical protein
MKSSRALGAMMGGAAAASIITNAALYLVFAVFMHMDTVTFFPAYLGFSLYAFIFGIAVASTIGIAWHALALRRGWRRSISYWGPAAICGFLLGFGFWLAIVSSFGVEDPDAWSILLYLASYGSTLGGFIGLFAWLIRRPDRDAPANPDSTAP